MHSIARMLTYVRPIPPSSYSTLPSLTHPHLPLTVMMPFANVTKNKRNHGAPPVFTPASNAAPTSSKSKSKPPVGPQLVRKPMPPPPPRNRVSASTDHYDENQSPPPKTPSSNRTRQYLQAESHRSSAFRIQGEQGNNAATDDPDPEAAPPPERPEGSDWQQLVDILFGHTP